MQATNKYHPGTSSGCNNRNSVTGPGVPGGARRGPGRDWKGAQEDRVRKKKKEEKRKRKRGAKEKKRRKRKKKKKKGGVVDSAPRLVTRMHCTP